MYPGMRARYAKPAYLSAGCFGLRGFGLFFGLLTDNKSRPSRRCRGTTVTISISEINSISEGEIPRGSGNAIVVVLRFCFRRGRKRVGIIARTKEKLEIKTQGDNALRPIEERRWSCNLIEPASFSAPAKQFKTEIMGVAAEYAIICKSRALSRRNAGLVSRVWAVCIPPRANGSSGLEQLVTFFFACQPAFQIPKIKLYVQKGPKRMLV